ncbi:MAG: hypothetical protein ABIA97_03800 [Candidatus Omnitrophota bacterium]
MKKKKLNLGLDICSLDKAVIKGMPGKKKGLKINAFSYENSPWQRPNVEIEQSKAEKPTAIAGDDKPCQCKVKYVGF